MLRYRTNTKPTESLAYATQQHENTMDAEEICAQKTARELPYLRTAFA